MPETPTRELLFSVTLADCKVETFSVGGAGGQHRDRTSNGVRITHDPSGVSGQGVDSRSQLENKRAAFTKLVQSPGFVFWAHAERRRLEGKESPADYAEREINDPRHVLLETRVDGKWVVAAFGDLAGEPERSGKRKRRAA